MLSLKDGDTVVAKIDGRKDKNKNLVFLVNNIARRDKIDIKNKCIILHNENEKFIPIPSLNEREVIYVAGPSGSGKTTYAVNYIKMFLKIFPDKDFFIFSRTDYKNDPAFKEMKPKQVIIDESLVDDPIDITQELSEGCIILFDDCNTIQNSNVKKAIDLLMSDIMEVGRKLNISIVITNHLVIPNEKKIARTILNECHCITVFPKSGSVQQIKYALKTYFGYSIKQIEKFINTDSRWITFKKTYPQIILSEYECFIP